MVTDKLIPITHITLHKFFITKQIARFLESYVGSKASFRLLLPAPPCNERYDVSRQFLTHERLKVIPTVTDDQRALELMAIIMHGPSIGNVYKFKIT